MGIPWELLHDGSQYLALKHPIGRRLWCENPVRRDVISEPSARSFLFIANPTEDLEEASIEIEELMDLFEPEFIAGTDPEFLAHSEATKWNVLHALGEENDLIHYSGHAEAGSLLLADGELTTEEIQKTLKGQPFVFLNACLSVRQAKSNHLSNSASYPTLMTRSLAEAFIMAGAVGFIGTLWQVFDKSSREFAEWFYTLLRKGVFVGEALRQARAQMYETRPGDPIWASFVLYGDPTFAFASVPSENRQTTVLVARLAGLLPLFNISLDMAILVRDQVIDLFQQVSQRYGGHFSVSSTNLFKIHFGVPITSENPATHALYVAREMIDKLKKEFLTNQYQTQSVSGLTLHVGISTGSVLYRSRSQKNDELIGIVEDVAATLAVHADAGQILVDQATSQSARSKFVFQAQDKFIVADELPSFVPYQVLHATDHGPIRSKFVGRKKDLAKLHLFWDEAKKDTGSVVAVTGYPGMGKSRFIQAFQEEIVGQIHRWVTVTCDIYNKSQSYNLLAQMIRGLAGIKPHDEVAVQRHKVKQLVHATIRGNRSRTRQSFKEGLSLLGGVIGIPFPMPEIDNLDPKLRQKQRQNFVVDIIKSQAARRPLILTLEDLQFADEASLTILDQIVKKVGQMRRIMLLVVYRPDEWQHEWANLRHYQKIWLDDLPDEAQKELLTDLLEGGKLPQKATQDILKQTGGHPLFIEEYFYFLKENGFLIRCDDRWQLTTDLSQISDLNQVEAVIQARLNRLDGESRNVLHNAAVIGVRFEREVLVKMQNRVANQSFDEHIDQLSERHFIKQEEKESQPPNQWQEEQDLPEYDQWQEEQDLPEYDQWQEEQDLPEYDQWQEEQDFPEYDQLQEEYDLSENDHWQDIHEPYSFLFYTFRHGLVHQIAYRLFPEPIRQSFHRLVANALRKLYGDQTDIYRLAHHYYQSSDRVSAIPCCLQAAKADMDKWANQAALEWYEQALEKIQSFDERPPTEKEQTEGATPAQIIEWHVEALEGQAEVQSILGKVDQAITAYKHALELVATSPGFPVTCRADLYRKLALTHHNKSAFDLALELLNKGLQILDGLVCVQAGRIYIHIGLIDWKHGRLTDALASCEQGIAIIKNTDNVRDLAQAYNLQGILYRRLKDGDKAGNAYKQSINLYEQTDYKIGLERASYNLACVYKDQGRWKDALIIFEKCEFWTRQTGEVLRQVAVFNGKAEIYLRLGNLDEAITNYCKAQQRTQEFGIEEFEGVARMNLGASYLKKGQLAEAREQLNKSLDIFQRRKANQRLPELLPHFVELEILSLQPNKALQFAQKAVEWVVELDYKQQKGQAKRSLGQAYRALEQFDEAATHLDESLKILEEREIPYEVGLTLLELALLSKIQLDIVENHDTLRTQAIAYCDRAIAIFDHLGAALDLEQAQQIRQSL